ncbi:relaxase/mobilization nuclease domain-containing protein [Roseibium sp.]|uniref:relaxase/mobilization nuclease domain-containing protein n=1 Tax=Roseibium sp. TaxID=1936156 RepID=UPI003A981B49
MLFVASERGNGKQLATHLLNQIDNEHVTVHEVKGFVSEDVTGAFKEAQACASGTRCKNYLFSVSLNPPEDRDVPISVFEETINRIETDTGLKDQPRVVVFHEKNGRRHAHCVWSRIDADTMTAKNLSHYKSKLMGISRDIHLEQDWKMPAGLAKGSERDPRNFSLAEWQQCKRMGKDAREIKTAIQDAWAISDNAATFNHALRERGLTLAKGDRRGHVAVTHEGEVLSIARYTGKKAKEVRAKLGEPENLPSVEEAKVQTAKDMRGAFQRHAQEAKRHNEKEKQRLDEQRCKMVAQHRAERQRLEKGQRLRFEQEARERSARINSGLKGLWQRVSGQRAKIQRQNEAEALEALRHDREQQDALIFQQMQDRRKLQTELKALRDRHKSQLADIRDDQRRYREMQRTPSQELAPPALKAEPPKRNETPIERPTLNTPMHDRTGEANAAFQRAQHPPKQTKPPSMEDRLERLRTRSGNTRSRSDRGPDRER